MDVFDNDYESKLIKIIFRLRRITPAKLCSYLNWKIVNGMDAFYDRQVTGLDLTKTEPVPAVGSRRVEGMTQSQPSHYLILEMIFSHVRITSEDSFMDVGCGKGRVLAFLLRKHCPCPLHGVELSEVPAAIVTKWTRKYDPTKVQVIIGDAFELDYDPYTVFFLSQPFYPATFRSFVELLERQLTHPVTFIYLFDHASGHVLEDRPGWEMKHREEFFQIHGLQVAGAIRRFTIWKYDPGDKQRQAES